MAVYLKMHEPSSNHSDSVITKGKIVHNENLSARDSSSNDDQVAGDVAF